MTMEKQNMTISCPAPHQDSAMVRLGHGSGGKMTAALIEDVFMPVVGNPMLSRLDDAADVRIASPHFAVSIDSYVVSPIFFPGGDIGSLAVHGTINDLSMRGAKPLFISASFILEEGLPIDDLKRVIASFQAACTTAAVTLIAADTKVVNRGAADRLFITTCGIGSMEKDPAPAAHRAKIGDKILISGDIGRHGMTIMSSREGLELESELESDSCPLNEVVAAALSVSDGIHCLRDITRGGLASVLNELSASSETGMVIDQDLVPVHPSVRAACELFGLDPLYVACEGRLVAIVDERDADAVLMAMRSHPFASESMMIGEVVGDHVGRVVLKSSIGGKRILDRLSGEQLPRIC